MIAIFEDRAGFLWLGTLDGLNRFDPRTEQFLVYRHNSQDPHSLSHNKVNAIWEDRQGTLWIGTENGLNQLDRSRGSFHQSSPDRTACPTTRSSRFWKTIRGTSGWPRITASVDFIRRSGAFRNYSESDGLPGNVRSGSGCRTPER